MEIARDVPKISSSVCIVCVLTRFCFLAEFFLDCWRFADIRTCSAYSSDLLNGEKERKKEIDVRLVASLSEMKAVFVAFVSASADVSFVK